MYLFALAGTRVAKHVKETTRACVHSPVPENGNGKIKTKREYVRNGPFRSSPVQLSFATRVFVFFTGTRSTDRTRELFFHTYPMYYLK